MRASLPRRRSSPGRTALRLLAWGAFAASCALAATSHAETISGPEFTVLARRSVDVMREHYWLLKRQLDVDETPLHLDYHGNFSLADVQFADGSTLSGSLERHNLTFGGGVGHPLTGGAVFLGLQVDVAQVGTLKSTGVTYKSNLYDSLLFAGIAAKGVEVSYGLRLQDGFNGLDSQGRFALDAPADKRASGSRSSVITIHQAEGVFFGGTIEDVTDASGATKRTLAAFRGLFSPERLLVREGLRRYGVPSLGVDRLAAGVDYYSDNFKAMQQALAAGGPLPTATAETYEVPFSIDDVARTGVRLRAVAQIAPSPLFRLAEAGWVYEAGRGSTGARVMTFQRSGKFVPSASAFAGYRIFDGIALAVTYAYNSPDSVTFFPLPDQHVFGVQVVYGDFRMARPIIPMVTETPKTRYTAQP